MSTADSLLLSISQVLTYEIGHQVFPNSSKDFYTWVGRISSIGSVSVALIVGLLWKEGYVVLRRDQNLTVSIFRITDLSLIQFGLGMNCIPTYLVGLFASRFFDCHPWSLTLGAVVGSTMTVVFHYTYIRHTPEFPVNSGIVGTTGNVMCVLLAELLRRIYSRVNVPRRIRKEEEAVESAVPPTATLVSNTETPLHSTDYRPSWDIPKTAKFGSQPLSVDLLKETYECEGEPGLAMVIVLLAFVVASVPIWSVRHDEDDDTPPSTIGGLPFWALRTLLVSFGGYIVLLAIIWRLPNSSKRRESTRRASKKSRSSESRRSRQTNIS